MFFRFAAALFLVVLISVAGIRLEKQSLELRRAVSLQHYQCDVLMDMIVQMRLETQRLTALQRAAHSPASTRNAARPGTDNPADRRPRQDPPATRVAVIPPVQAGNSRGPVSEDPMTDDQSPGASGVRKRELPLLEFPAPFDPEGID